MTSIMAIKSRLSYTYLFPRPEHIYYCYLILMLILCSAFRFCSFAELFVCNDKVKKIKTVSVYNVIFVYVIPNIMTVIAKLLLNVYLTIYHAFDVKQPSVPKEGQLRIFLFYWICLVWIQMSLWKMRFCLLLLYILLYFTHGLFVFIDKNAYSRIQSRMLVLDFVGFWWNLLQNYMIQKFLILSLLTWCERDSYHFICYLLFTFQLTENLSFLQE